MMQLAAVNLQLGYGGKPVIDSVDLDINSAEITVIIGPNGSGKSTLLAGLAGQQRPLAGSVCLEQKPLAQWPRRALARKLALLPQQPQAPEDILVEQMVAYGRFAHRKLLAPLSSEDHDKIQRAMAQTQVAQFARRPVRSLSGGQRQRAWIAMSLAQSPQLLLLDEPTSYLDVGFQHQILDLLKQLNRERGLGMVMVLHDINQASFYADRLLVLEAGRLIADGKPEDIIDAELMRRLYHIDMRVLRSEKTARPFCIPEHL